MNYSNNIQLLTKDIFTSPDSIILTIKKSIGLTKLYYKDIHKTPDSIHSTPDSIPYAPEDSPDSIPYAPGIPGDSPYQPTQEELDMYEKQRQEYIAANPNSPVYNPNSPGTPGSSIYNPNSPGTPGSSIYNPNSPGTPGSPYWPDSPDYPPDYNQQHMMGGGNKFNVGDPVLFRGGNKPTQLWNIKNVGDKFITIEAQDSYGMDPNETIKVVTMFDIYRPGDFSYNNQPTSQLYNSPNQPQSTIQVPDSSSTPAINIKIVNGNDMTEQSGAVNNEQPLIKMNSQQDAEANEPVNTLDFNSGMVIKKIN
jgi:hypothetical protein